MNKSHFSANEKFFSSPPSVWQRTRFAQLAIKMQCANAACGYAEVSNSRTLLGIALESLVIELEIALDMDENFDYFESYLNFFEKREFAFKCNYLIKKRINRPLFKYELIFRADKKIHELLRDIKNTDHQFFSFVEWCDVGGCPKCLFEKIRLFFKNENEFVGVAVNTDSVDDFDLTVSAKKEGDAEYWIQQAVRMEEDLEAAAMRRHEYEVYGKAYN